MVLRKSPSLRDSGSTWQQRLVPDDPAAGWRDMIGPISMQGTDQADPTPAAILNSGHRAFKFVIGNHFSIVYHLNHDYRPGSPIYLHVHWCADGVDGNPVRWQFNVEYAQGFGRGRFDFSDNEGTQQILQIEEAPLAPLALDITPDVFDQLAHMTTECEVPIVRDVFEPDGILLVTLTRITNGAVDNQDGIFVFTSDAHYQVNGICTTARQPPFVEND